MRSIANQKFDAIVVGAGPAGCRAALTLADGRRRVLLLDRERFPRWKPCAGGVTAKALPYVDPALRDRFERTMRGAVLTFGERHTTHVRGDEPLGWMVHREAFDRAHLELVRSRPGVLVLEGTRARAVEELPGEVRVLTDAGEHHASCLIGADGVNGVVSRHLSGHDGRRYAVAYEGEAESPDPRLVDDVLFDFRRFAAGYGWVFPKRDHYSVGGYVCGAPRERISDDYDRFCEDLTLLEGCETYRRRGYRIPLGGGHRKLNTGRVMLAGDAAGLVDPLTGEGIYYALRSGQMAADAAAALLDRDASLDGYTRAVDVELRAELRRARRLAELLWGRSRLVGFLLVKNRIVCRWCVEILSGRRSYASLRGELRGNLGSLLLGFRPWARQRVLL